MPLKYTLTIRDPVHGLMRFTRIEQRIIDLPVFQRLRRLRQSALASYTYPTALTTRFEHSLGALHVAQRILNHLREEYSGHFDTLCGRVRETYNIPVDVPAVDVVFQAVRLACMFHDIGHLPLSHCFEEELDAFIAQEGREAWGREFQEGRCKYDRLYDEHNLPSLKLHEYLSFVIARDHDGIRKVIAEEHADAAHALALDLLNPFGCVDTFRDRSIYNVFGNIVHGEVDADRMDFLLRDSGITGSSLGSFDLDRLILSQVIHRHASGEYQLHCSVRGLSSIERFFLARLAIYRWQYFHHNAVFYDLVARLVFVKLLQNDLLDKEKCNVLAELCARTFLEQGDASQFHRRDDALVWAWFLELHRVAMQKFYVQSAPALERLLVLLEELLHREKRHTSLWKDQEGYHAFESEVFKAIARRSRRDDPEERARLFCEACVGERDPDCAHRIAAHFVRGLSQHSDRMDQLRQWLERKEVPILVIFAKSFRFGA